MNDDREDKPTMGERYSRAATSSHLRAQPGRCDVDYLIAAGWLQDGLGSMLYRLRAEFDAVRAELRKEDAQLPRWKAVADAAKDLIRHHGSPIPKQVLEEPERIREEAKRAALNERAMVLVRLKTLVPAKQALGRFGVVLATKVLFMQNDAAVGVMVGRALDAWLDPICPACDGRGFHGDRWRGDPKITCRDCRGTKQRRAAIGMDSEERRFVGLLLGEVEEMLFHIDQVMRSFLAQHGAPADAGVGSAAAASHEIQARLKNLRSVEAETD